MTHTVNQIVQDATDMLTCMPAEFHTSAFITASCLYTTNKTPDYAFKLLQWLIDTAKITRTHKPNLYVKT